jgi:molybdate transport system substrate-binding protein
MKRSRLFTAIAAIAVACALTVVRAADDLTVLSSNGYQAVLEDLAPRFERATKRKLAVTYDLAATLRQQIEGGRSFDLAILTPAAIDDLIKAGRVTPASRTPLARVGLGFAIRAGARKPDVTTADAFKRTLTDTPSITYVKEGASGVAFAALLQRIGMADALKPKTKLASTRDEVGEVIARGDAQLGVLPVSEILPMKGIQLGGAFPADVQTYIVMVAGASAKSADSKGVDELIRFLTAADATPVLTAKGMERVK